MVTYEVAVDMAKRIEPKVDSYQEYPDVFIFTNSKATGDDQWDNEIVISKNSGKVISYVDFIMDSKYADMDVVPKLI